MTFELHDNAKQCFFEVIDANVKTLLEYQVITGGNFDVDVELTAPNGQSLYKDVRKQYDSYMFTTSVKGEYKFCFSNEFSTFSHKIVYFDFQVGDDQPLNAIFGNPQTALTQVNTYIVAIHANLQSVNDMVNEDKIHDLRGFKFALSLKNRVNYWSIGQMSFIIVIGIGQIFILRGLFTEKRTTGIQVIS